jgi:hypothetical protein
MNRQNLHRAAIDSQQLRFLRYRQDVVSTWAPSEEKDVRLRVIQAQIDLILAG